MLVSFNCCGLIVLFWFVFMCVGWMPWYLLWWRLICVCWLICVLYLGINDALFRVVVCGFGGLDVFAALAFVFELVCWMFLLGGCMFAMFLLIVLLVLVVFMWLYLLGLVYLAILLFVWLYLVRVLFGCLRWLLCFEVWVGFIWLLLTFVLVVVYFVWVWIWVMLFDCLLCYLVGFGCVCDCYERDVAWLLFCLLFLSFNSVGNFFVFYL